MFKKNLLLIFIIIVTISWNSCNGHAIKLQPAASYSASYSGSSASSSAFSHSSSSSFSVNGNLDHNNNDDGVLEALKTGAVATASAGAASVENLAEAGAVSAAHATSGSVAAANSGTVTGNSAANSNAGAYSSATQNSNAEKIGSSSSSGIDETYKTIGSNKYTTGYSGATTLNQHANKVHQASSDTAGCTSCVKKPFPGPDGSIHDYKIVSSVAPSVLIPAVSVVTHPNTPSIIVNPNTRPAHQSTAYVVNLIPTFPGPSGSIHSSKPVTNNNNNAAATFSSTQSGSFAHQQQQQQQQPAQNVYHHAGPTSVNNHHGISSSDGSLSGIISQLPGPSGSIYDSKPAVGAGSVAHSSAVAESSSNSYGGNNFAVVPTIPVPITPVIMPIYASAAEKFPGPSGSIYSSYPAVNNVPSNIPLTHPIVGPVCSYYPGSPNKCENNKSSGSETIQGNLASSVSANEAYSGAGSITNNPISISSGNSCRYSTQDGKCGSASVNEANTVNSHAAASAAASAVVTDNASYKGPFPGPSGSIYDSKPVPTLSTANTASTFSSNYNSDSSSSSEIDHYTTGAVLVPTTTTLIKEDFNTPNNIISNVNNVVIPSIHPEAPSGGTYYVNKPALDIQAPELSFVAQIPCADSSCASTIKKTSGLSASNSYSNSGSNNFVYKNNDKNEYSSNLGHDTRIVYKNDDGSYYNGEKTHQNGAHGGYAISPDDADNKGILHSPGTGFLPVEDHQKSNFGHQKSVAGASENNSNNKAGATSAASISFAASSAQSSNNHVNSAENSDINNNKAVKIGPIKCFTCNGAGDSNIREVVVVEEDNKPSSSHVGQDFGTNYVNNNNNNNGAYFNYPETGVLLNKLFGGNNNHNKAEAFSGAVSKASGNNDNNNGQSGSAAYSSAGSFASSGGTSFASASSHAGSYGR